MKHVRTIPAAGFMPEMFSFSCAVCACPRTEEKPALSMEAIVVLDPKRPIAAPNPNRPKAADLFEMK